jgi:hypothetical protein
MAPGKFLASLLVIVIFSLGGFGLMHWLQSAPAPMAVTTTGASRVVVDLLSGCQSFNQSIDEEIARQDGIGQTHISVRLAALKRDCVADARDYSRAAPR